MVLEMLLSDMPDVGYKWNDAGSPHPNPLPRGEGIKRLRSSKFRFYSLSP